MDTIKRIAVASVVVAASVGVAVPAASAAYAWIPPSTAFTGVNIGAHTFSAGGLSISCTNTTYSGVTPASGGTLSYRPVYTGCRASVAGTTFAAAIAANADWSVTLVSGAGGGPFGGSVTIGSGSPHAVVLTVAAIGCAMYVDSAFNNALSTLTALKTTTSVQLINNLPYLTYTQNGNCPIPATGGMNHQGVIDIPGITVSG